MILVKRALKDSVAGADAIVLSCLARSRFGILCVLMHVFGGGESWLLQISATTYSPLKATHVLVTSSGGNPSPSLSSQQQHTTGNRPCIGTLGGEGWVHVANSSSGLPHNTPLPLPPPPTPFTSFVLVIFALPNFT